VLQGYFTRTVSYFSQTIPTGKINESCEISAMKHKGDCDGQRSHWAVAQGDTVAVNLGSWKK